MKIEHKIGDKLTCPECGNQFIFDETCNYRTSDYVCSLNCFNKSVKRYYEAKKAMENVSVDALTTIATDNGNSNKITTAFDNVSLASDTPKSTLESTETDSNKKTTSAKKRGRPVKSKE